MEIKDGLPTVILAGAAGHLGRKIYKRLLTTTAAEYVDVPLSGRPIDATTDSQGGLPTRFRIILMDAKPCPSDFDLHDTRGHEVEYVQCDFTKLDSSWSEKFKNAYVAFLLATKVKYPSATSEEAYDSMLINANLLEACAAAKVERVVIGSSTDVVRGKMDKAVEHGQQEHPPIDATAEPEIPESKKLYGSVFDSRLYAAAKVAAENQARAMVASGLLNRVVILRLGAAYPIEKIAPNEQARKRWQQNRSHLHHPSRITRGPHREPRITNCSNGSSRCA